jgi:hypothetical protein
MRAAAWVLVWPLTAYADDTVQDPTACVNDSGVVGDRACPEFGKWGTAREHAYTIATIGFHVRVLPRAPRDIIARTTAETPTAGGDDVSQTFAEGVTFEVVRPLYLGLEVEIGMSDVGTVDASSRAVRVGGFGLVGLHVPLGPLAISGELAAGGRLVETLRSDPIDGDGVLEARVRAMLWLTPWLTGGGVLGTSLVNEGEWMAGVQLSFHSWSFGGR